MLIFQFNGIQDSEELLSPFLTFLSHLTALFSSFQ